MNSIFTHRSFPLTALATAVALLLSACGAPMLTRQADDQARESSRVADRMQPKTSIAEQGGENIRGGAANADHLAELQRAPISVRRATMPYIGSQLVRVTDEDRLPAVFQEPFPLDFPSASLQVAMARLSKLAKVPIRIQSDVFEKSEAPKAAAVPGPALGGTLVPGMPVPMPSPVLTNSGAPAMSPAATVEAGSVSTVAKSGRGKKLANQPDPVSQAQPTTLQSVEMKNSGTLTDYLNTVTDRLGLAWSYRDNTIVISRFVVESYEVFAASGASKFSMGGSGTSGGSAGGSGTTGSTSSTSDVSESGESNPLVSIQKAVDAMMKDVPGSSVLPSDGSGRLVVKTSREMQSRVRDYIRSENAAMRRQAQIQFDIYSVSINDSDQHGVDWNAAFQSLRYPALQLGLASPTTLTDVTAGAASLKVLPSLGGTLSQTLGNSSAIVQALTERGYAAQHRAVPLFALNRRFATSNRLNTQYYLAETTPGPASSTGVGAPGLKTDKITTGDRFMVMPQIMDDNTVLLTFDTSMLDLLKLADITVGNGLTQQKVQAPNTSGFGIHQSVSLRPGEAVMITGLSRDVANSDRRTLGENVPLVAGGSKTVSTTKEYFLIFVRAVIL